MSNRVSKLFKASAGHVRKAARPKNVYVPSTIIWCGWTPSIALSTRFAFEPEFEVVHVCLGIDQAINDIPQLLRNMIPRTRESESANLGTQSYCSKVVAVVMGLGFPIIDVVRMREACGNDRGVPWLMADITRFEGPMIPGAGEEMVQRAKECLKELEKEGNMGKDGFHLY